MFTRCKVFCFYNCTVKVFFCCKFLLSVIISIHGIVNYKFHCSDLNEALVISAEISLMCKFTMGKEFLVSMYHTLFGCETF